MSEEEEKLPISEVYKVIEYKTLGKSKSWWSAVVMYNAFGRQQIGVYLWQKRNGKWRRKQKFVVKNRNQWEDVKKVIEEFLGRL